MLHSLQIGVMWFDLKRKGSFTQAIVLTRFLIFDRRDCVNCRRLNQIAVTLNQHSCCPKKKWMKRNGWNCVSVCLYIENIEKRENFLFLPKKNFQNGLSCLLWSHTVRSQEKTSIEDKCKAGWARRCFKNTFDYSLSLSRCDGQLCFSSRSLLTCSTTGTVSNVIKIDMHLVLFQQRIWHRRFLVFVQNILHTDCKDCGDVWSKRWHHFQKASARPFPSHGDSFFSQKNISTLNFSTRMEIKKSKLARLGFQFVFFWTTHVR